MRYLSTFVLCVICISTAALAQNPSGKNADAEAAQAYSLQQWDRAEHLYSELTQTQPANARYWYRYAVSARADKHYDIALKAFDEAKKNGQGKGLPAFLVDYEVAATQAAMGHPDDAFTALKSAIFVFHGRQSILIEAIRRSP